MNPDAPAVHGSTSAGNFNPARLRILGRTPDGTGEITLVYDDAVLARFADERSFDKDEGVFSGLTDIALHERARVLALAWGLAADAPPRDYPPPRRYLAPDGRLLLEFHVGFDPRDIHEQQPQWRPRVYDARTGAKLLDLLRIDVAWTFDWERDGALRLTGGDTAVRMTPVENLFTTSMDGWQPHPLAQAQMIANRLLPRDRDRDPMDGRVRRTTLLERLVWPLAAVGAVAGMVFLAGGALPGVGGTMVAGDVPIDGWIVQCRGSDLPVMLHRSARGSLEVPPELAPAPLPALAADRYGDGRMSVEIHGTSATVRSGGGLRCVSPNSD